MGPSIGLGLHRRRYTAILNKPPLIKGLHSWWDFEEVGVNDVREDAIGDLPFVPINTVAGVPGLVGNAVQNVAANQENLSATFPGGQSGNPFTSQIAGTVCGWARPDNLAGFGSDFCWFNNYRVQAGVHNGFRFRIIGGAANKRLRLDYGKGTQMILQHNGVIWTDGVWHFIVMRWDQSVPTITLSVDLTAEVSVADTWNPPNRSNIFLTRRGSVYHEGLIDSTAYYDRFVPDAELALLYNGGAGVNFQDLAGLSL